MFLKVIVFISIFLVIRKSIVKILFRKILNSEQNPNKRKKLNT